MRLTREEPNGIDIAHHFRRLPAWWTVGALAAALGLVFQLDHRTASAPVQHLYYLPIILASLRFGRAVSVPVSLVSILLYHLANPALLVFGYHEADVVQIVLFIVVALVASKLSDDARRLRHLAMTDDLTGLHNLRSFEAHLASMMRVSRASQAPVAMLVLDVDRLKAINDTYGHLAGAEAVRTVGRVLATRLPPGSVACRYGGDEFAVAIPTCDALQAKNIADDLRGAVQALAPVLAGERFPARTLGISVGLASAAATPNWPASSATDDLRDGEALFRAADEALYLAKARGRNQVAVTAPLTGINPALTSR